MMLGMLVAIPAVALAADLNTDAVLSTNAATPTYVKVGANSFQIKVWATANLAAAQTGAAQVVNKYDMNTSGTITADTTSQTSLDFAEGHQYNPGGGYCPADTAANQGTGPQGCKTNPFVVNATLNVASGTAHDTTGVLTVSNTGSPGLAADATPDTGNVKVDAAGPAITLNPPAEGDSYDVGDSVTVDYSCSDSGSGVKSCVGDQADGATLDTSTPGSYTFTVNAEDNFGNTSSVTHHYTVVNPDSTAPTSTARGTVPDGNDAGTDPDDYSSGTWTNQNVTVTLDASDNDGGSSVKELTYSATGADPISPAVTKAAANLPTSFTIDAEGTTTISYHAVDNNNNVESANTFVVKIDKTDPAPNCGSASASWLGIDAQIACNPTDSGGSGLAGNVPSTFNLVTSVPADTEDSNASTDSRTISDVAGNTATAGPITGNKIDKKDPSFSCDPAPTTWSGSDVNIDCSASDGGSGLNPLSDATFQLSTSVDAGVETSNASTGTKGLSDAVGNTATAGPITGIKVDKKGPAITLTTPAATTYTLGQVVNADYGCSDGGSGLLSCSGTVNNGSAIDTSTIGPHSFKVDAEDNVNNKNSLSRDYSVAAAFNGFLQPIDGDMVNAGKTGRVYPVKWQLKNNSGNLISDALGLSLAQQMSVEQKGVPCVPDQVDSLETEVAAGSTTIRYDEASDQFIFNYKAPTAKGCYDLNLKKADGVNTKTVKFTFTK